MKFSYNGVWDETMRLLRAHGGLLAAIAGVFIFLPTLLVAQLLPPPEQGTLTPVEYFRAFLHYYWDHRLWILIEGFVVMTGSIAILRLVLSAGTTVAAALAFAGVLLAPYSVLALITGLMVGFATILLVVPGLYLAGRLVPAGAAMVAENRRNPIDAIRRSFTLTGGNGWRVLGLVVLVYIAGMVLMLVIQSLAGIVFILAAGQHIGTLLATIVGSAVYAVFLTVLTVLYAAIYRTLAGPGSAA